LRCFGAARFGLLTHEKEMYFEEEWMCYGEGECFEEVAWCEMSSFGSEEYCFGVDWKHSEG
jgi:hypothetical protein